MEQKDFHDILKKYRMGNATPEEKKVIDAWYQAMGAQGEVPEHTRKEDELEKHYWQNIAKQINVHQQPGTDLPGRKAENWSLRVKYIVGIAALFLVVALAYFYSWVNKPAQQQTAHSTSNKEAATAWKIVSNSKNIAQSVSLPDGTTVTLEPRSSIKFSPLTAPAREVYLDGQAFFNVIPNERQPFLVYAKDVTAKVLGTSFMVKAFQADEKVTVEVATGKVAVLVPAGNTLNNASAVVLTPNQKMVYDWGKGKVSRQIVDTPKQLLTSEEVRRMHFEDAPLPDIFQAIEKIYGVDIDFDAAVFSSCTLTTSLPGDGLYNRLNIICSAVGARYTVLENKIQITGKGCNERPPAP